MDVTNKVVIVTRANAGVGSAAAVLFAKHGAKLALVARKEVKLRKIADQCEKEGGLTPLVIVADLETESGCKMAAEEAMNHYGRVDVLVNTAGVGSSMYLEQAQLTFDEMFILNITGAYNLTRVLLPEVLLEVNDVTDSPSAPISTSYANKLSYNDAKVAMNYFAGLVASELETKDGKPNNANSGVKVTKFVSRFTKHSEQQYQALMESAVKMIPLGKEPQPELVAMMILLLARDSEPVTEAWIPDDEVIDIANNDCVNHFRDQVKTFTFDVKIPQDIIP